VPFLVSLAISFLITWLMIRWAPFLALVDIPNERKVHNRPIPKGGGLGIFVGWFSAALLLGLDSKELSLWGGIGLIIVVLGLVDDIRPLPWQWRLAIQTIAAIAGIWQVRDILGNRPSILPEYLLWPAAVIWIVGLTNAFNMLDNMDALSAGVAWIAAALFAFTSILVIFHAFFTILYSAFGAQIMLMGGLTGFLWFNRPLAKIFMGDAGSTFLGFFFGTNSMLLAGLFVPAPAATDRGPIFSSLFVPDIILAFDPGLWPLVFCFLFIPWYDLTSVVTIRLCQGRSPFHADKQHLSHRLVALGLSKPKAVATICLLAAIIGSTGLLIFSLVPAHGPTLSLIFIGVCSMLLAVFELVAHRRIRHGSQQTPNC